MKRIILAALVGLLVSGPAGAKMLPSVPERYDLT